MKRTASIFSAALVSTSAAFAWKWADEPQPLLRYERTSVRAGALRGRAPVTSGAGAPLAWDQSARILWSISGNSLSAEIWNGSTFIQVAVDTVQADRNGGLLVDSGLHFLFYLDPRGLPQCAKRAGRSWAGSTMGEEPLTRLLAVDARRHTVFGYDAAARGIRLYRYDARARTWTSSVIAAGLGAAGDAGVVDNTGPILYSSHDSVDATVPRHPAAGTVGDPTGIGEFKPWPLVVTSWDGQSWTSRVIDETGVPQLPAVRLTDHRVFYARRDEPALTYYYQPASGKIAESFGNEAGWTGSDTYVDDSRYVIRAPQYPAQWGYGFVQAIDGGVSSSFVVVMAIGSEIPLQGPITIVPYYAPVWEDVALPPRLARFRAIVNPRQNRLVQHREIFSGEILRQQTDKRLVGYLYRDAKGTMAASCWITSSIQSYYGYVDTYYPELDNRFDPANAPENFSALADTNLPFLAYRVNTTAATAEDRNSSIRWHYDSIPTYFSTDPAAAFVTKHLRLPTLVSVHTFGHNYGTNLVDQLGGRYQEYRQFGTNYAVPTELAVDFATGVTFYTQAPTPSDNEEHVPVSIGHSNPPLAGFRPEPDPKWQSSGEGGWVVMVY